MTRAVIPAGEEQPAPWQIRDPEDWLGWSSVLDYELGGAFAHINTDSHKVTLNDDGSITITRRNHWATWSRDRGNEVPPATRFSVECCCGHLGYGVTPEAALTEVGRHVWIEEGESRFFSIPTE